MKETKIYFVTNRRHEGADRRKPSGYGIERSDVHGQNLRFGMVTAPYKRRQVDEALKADCGFGVGHGDRLADYFLNHTKSMSITTFEENLEVDKPDAEQAAERFGSTAFLGNLRSEMEDGADVLIFIHGFNVGWWDSVCSALSLQLMLNRGGGRCVHVVFVSWPSDGSAVPFRSYFSDRGDAKALHWPSCGAC